MKKCPNCGAQIADDSQFCTECGKSIPQGNVCSHCGAQVNDGDAFCPNCGSKTDKQPISVSPAPEQKHCPHCGTLVSNDSLFCENCGKNMSNGASAPTNISFQSQEPYKAESSSQNKLILPIVIGLLVLALAGGGWWYYNSSKSKMSGSGSVITPNSNDSIANAQKMVVEDTDADSIEDTDDAINMDSVMAEMVYVDGSPYSDVSVGETAVDGTTQASTLEKTAKGESEEKQSQQSETSNKVHDVVEQMPSFPGGDAALMRFLSTNVHYPAVAEENGIQGRVVVTFIIERDGSISDVKVVKSVDPSLDKEAVRVIESMPRWKAGTQNGEPVRVKYTMPVTFRLQ